MTGDVKSGSRNPGRLFNLIARMLTPGLSALAAQPQIGQSLGAKHNHHPVISNFLEKSAALNRFYRQLLTVLILISAVLTFMGTGNAQTNRVVFRLPSPSGNYLAGQQAFDTLSTKEAAQAFLDATESQWDNPEVIERAFAALAADGRIGDAEDLARHMLELEPNHDLATLLLGTVSLKERRYTSSIKQLQSLGLENFIDIAGAIVQAWARVGQSDLDEAFGVLDELGDNGLESFLLFHQALMADFSGDPRATDYIAQAYQTDPFVARNVEAYARILGNAGETEAALEVLNTFEREGLTHPYVDEVRVELEAGRLPGKYATSIAEGASELYHGIGAALARDGAPDIAMVFLRLGLYLHPKSDIIALTIGSLYDSAGRYESANHIYSSIDEASPFKSDAIVRVAGNLDALGDREEALRRLGNIVQVQPENLEAVVAMADLLRADEQYGRAVEYYTKAIGIVGGDRPRDWRYFYARGIANERDGDWDAAEIDLLRALELNPDQPQVLNYLGYSWVDQGLNLDRALGMIEKAVSGNPRDGYIVDSLGWAIYKLERYEEAVTILEEAVRLLPNDPEINDHLGDAYWYAGRKREARFQWTIAGDVDQRGAVSERIIPKLQDGLGNG